ncbi:AraC family transcriptional regulator [bacterium]|nr:MAG: AraC family transcriptional regulator [bacterium]
MTFAACTVRWSETSDGTESAVVQRCAANGSAAHDHDFMELAVVLRGSAVHSCPEGSSALSCGSAVLLRPGVWHAYLGSHDLEVLNFCFPFAMAQDHWRHMVDERVKSMLGAHERVRLAQLPLESVEALETLEGIRRDSTGGLGLLMWTLDQFASVVPVRSSGHPAVDQAVRCLEEAIHRPWTATDLARTVGLDKAYLSRLFKAQIGTGPMAYLAALRVDRAASLLRHSELTCGEIGATVGYADPSVFSRRFRARFGTSPQEYRRSPTE